MARFLNAVLFLAICGLSTAEAQQNTPTGVFKTMEACEASSSSYTPSFLSGHKPLGAGERLVTLAQRQCGEMFIAGGRWAIVGQAAGTQAVSANGVIVRRWDCGNGMRGFVIPAVPVPVPAPGPVVPPPAGAAKVDVNVFVTNMFKDNKSEPAPAPKKSWCGTGCKWLIGTAIVGTIAGVVWNNQRQKKSVPPPKHEEKVQTLPPCTALPCP